MHPAAVAVIVVSGVILLWGGYEAINTLYEWHNDRKEQREYEEYIKMHTEKGRYVPVTVFENEDKDDDDEPLAFWKQKREESQSELRHRVNTTSDYDEFGHMQKRNEEAELERKKQAFLRSKGNNITGVVILDEQVTVNPFADPLHAASFSSDLDSSWSDLSDSPKIDSMENLESIHHNQLPLK